MGIESGRRGLAQRSIVSPGGIAPSPSASCVCATARPVDDPARIHFKPAILPPNMSRSL